MAKLQNKILPRISCWILAVGLFATWCSAEEPAWPQVLLEKAELDKEQWGEAAQVEGKPCRVLKAGQRGSIPLKAWWSEGLRPKQGRNALAAIEFKDTASAPIVVQAFAGLPGRYELHRIGGLKDGQWKTALVPVPWDMVMLLPGKKNTELVLIAPGGADVPVASVKLKAGKPEEDEARWAAETRAWAARVQGEKRSTASSPKPQTALLEEPFSKKAVVPFARPYIQLIYKTSAPQKGEAGAPLKKSMALNEIEPLQFGVYANGADLKNVRISIAPKSLKDQKGNALDCDVNLFAAEYAATKNGKLFPQRIWPAYALDIAKGQSHMFWINIETRKGKSAPGTYRGKVQVASDGQEPVEVPLEITVLPITLLTMKEAGLHIGGCTTGLLPAHEMQILNRHNTNSINLWFSGVQPKITKKSSTEFDLNFDILDDYMKHARAAGTENFVWFLGGNPYSFPDAMHLERELYRQVHFDGDDMMAGRKEYIVNTCKKKGAMLPGLRDLYKTWVKKVMTHAQEKNWPEPILTPFDEPAKWSQGNWAKADIVFVKDKHSPWHTVAKLKKRDKEKFMAKYDPEKYIIENWGVGGADTWIKGHFKDSCAAIHEAWPKTRIYGSIHHAKPGLPFLPDIEVFCTNAIHEDHELGNKVRAGGKDKVFWQYSGTADATEPAAARYAFGVFFAAFNSRGSLVWAYNWGGRFDTSNGNNWIYAWTSPYSLVRAPFFEGMREAWDDRRYIETLKHLAGKKSPEQQKVVKDLLEKIFNEAVQSRTKGGRDTVNNFFARSKNPKALDAIREKIANGILELQK